MTIKQQLSQNKIAISKTLTNYLKNKQKNFSTHSWSKDVFDRLIPFATAGKMIRGSMSLVVNELFGNYQPEESLKVSAAIELYQTGLLIQDDVMDQDETRRGLPSIYFQYQQFAKQQDYHNAKQFGEGVGFYVGDISLFLVFDLLSHTNLEPDIKNNLYSVFATELAGVVLGQIQDLKLANTNEDISEDDILKMYMHKTARYTFLLPFVSGAILAKQDQLTIKLLKELADLLGLIFQIKDDEIGIFGDTKKTGKPAGNDIREGKKTLFYYHLLKNADKRNKQKLLSIFGNQNITEAEIEFVKTQIMDSGVYKKIQNKLETLAKDANKLILQINNNEAQQFFQQLIDYSLNRQK